MLIAMHKMRSFDIFPVIIEYDALSKMCGRKRHQINFYGTVKMINSERYRRIK